MGWNFLLRADPKNRTAAGRLGIDRKCWDTTIESGQPAPVMEKLKRLGICGAGRMIDVYRFILALCVVQGHLVGRGESAPWLAWQAVFSFYVLSGFLMSLVLNQDYGFTVGGLVRFAVNRWLRLFPVYYAVIGLTALYIAFIGPLDQLNQEITLPSSATAIFANLSIVTLTGFDFTPVMQRLSPTTWSLAIEIFCYFLLAVYCAKSRARLLFMLTVGVAVTAAQIFIDFDQPRYGFQNHYGVLQAGLIPFALGGLAYFYRGARIFEFSAAKLGLLGMLFLANFVVCYWSDFHKYVSCLYLAAMLNALLVPMLFTQTTKHSWQKILGGLSYPIFLCHWVVATLILIYVPAIGGKGFMLFAAATVGSALFSVLLYYGVDRPIQALRTAVKKQRFMVGQRKLKTAAGM
jgi:peptidoglycan/LPS O-acetylase OafA/YrhL